MADQTKAGDIGAGIGSDLHHHIFAVLVQGCHRLHHLVVGLFIQQLCLVGGGQHADSDWLGQHQKVALLAVAVFHDLVRVDKSGDAQTIFRLRVLNGVASGNNRSCLLDLACAALHDFCHHIHRQTGRETNQVHRKGWISSHRVNIAQRVCRRNLSKGIGVIHDWREKVYCLNNSKILSHLIDQRVIAGIKSDDEIVVGKFW